MTGVRIIPFPSAANWVMDIQLSGRVYTIRGRWNTRLSSWTLDLETADGERLLSGVRVVLEYPLLPDGRTDDMPPGELAVVCPTGRCRQDPSRTSIGDDQQLRFVYVEPAE